MGCVLTILLATISSAHAVTIDQTLDLSSSGNNGPLEFDYGVVSTGITAEYGASIEVVNNTGEPVSLTPPVNGSLGSCASVITSGSSCVETISYLFLQLPSTPAGIYTGQVTYDYPFVDASGDQITDPVTFEYSINVGDVAATPLPAALPLFAGGLCALGLLAWRRRPNRSEEVTHRLGPRFS